MILTNVIYSHNLLYILLISHTYMLRIYMNVFVCVVWLRWHNNVPVLLLVSFLFSFKIIISIVEIFWWWTDIKMIQFVWSEKDKTQSDNNGVVFSLQCLGHILYVNVFIYIYKMALYTNNTIN